MQIKKVKITNMFGIEEFEFEGGNVEFKGKNGVGKTSFIDAVIYALKNDSERDYIIKNGESEGQIFVETDTGLQITRKKRNDKTDYKNVKIGKQAIAKPEGFLKTIFTELQLNPIEFLNLDKRRQNEIILDLIVFLDNKIEFIKKEFDDLPEWIDYEDNILTILNNIQSEKGDYFIDRQEINRQIRHKKATIDDIREDIPDSYNYDKWKKLDIGTKYEELQNIRNNNIKIEKSEDFVAGYQAKVDLIKSEMLNEIKTVENDAIAKENKLRNEIEILKQQILSKEKEIENNETFKKDRIYNIDEKYKEKINTLDSYLVQAKQISENKKIDTTDIEEEIQYIKDMQKHVGDYERILKMKEEVETLTEKSEFLTEKIEKARYLPGKILETAEIPIPGISVENGIALINGLPVSNLSTGEQLKLCVNIASNKTDGLKTILIDGTECLSSENKKELFEACKEKGLQIIATTTTDSNELEIIYF